MCYRLILTDTHSIILLLSSQLTGDVLNLKNKAGNFHFLFFFIMNKSHAQTQKRMYPDNKYCVCVCVCVGVSTPYTSYCYVS